MGGYLRIDHRVHIRFDDIGSNYLVVLGASRQFRSYGIGQRLRQLLEADSLELAGIAVEVNQ